jgi:hypothetical protein
MLLIREKFYKNEKKKINFIIIIYLNNIIQNGKQGT